MGHRNLVCCASLSRCNKAKSIYRQWPNKARPVSAFHDALGRCVVFYEMIFDGTRVFYFYIAPGV